MWSTCAVCQENRPQKTKEVPIKEMLLDLHPIESLNMDFCQYADSYYVVAVDRYSGYLWAKQVPQQTTEEACKFLQSIWNVHSLSREIRCDYGPGFRKAFQLSSAELGVDVQHSASYHPQGNIAAERALQELKKYFHKNWAIIGQ